MNIFETASRIKLRFHITGEVSGTFTVEGLWDFAKNKVSVLKAYEVQLEDLTKSSNKSERRARLATKSKEQQLNELRLEIVSYILDVTELASEKASKEAKIKEKRNKLLLIADNKKEEELNKLSIDEIDLEIKKLEAELKELEV